MLEIRKPNPPLNFRSKLTPLKKVDMIVLHHMAHKTAGIYDVHHWHKNKTYTNSAGKASYWSGIGYNYFITFDGIIYEARGLHVGAHTSGYNNRSIGIGFQGDFQQQQMSDAQLKAGAALCAKLLKDYSLAPQDIKKHNDLAATGCPGKNFRFAELKELLNPGKNSFPAENDVIYTVQVGAFKNKANAEKLREQLVGQGYTDIFISKKFVEK